MRARRDVRSPSALTRYGSADRPRLSIERHALLPPAPSTGAFVAIPTESMRSSMLQRSLLLLTAALAAMAVASAPPRAGEETGAPSSPPAATPPAPATPAPGSPAPAPAAPKTGSARLRASQGCVTGKHAKAVV